MPHCSVQSLAPAAKARSQLIRVVTWNIHCGQDDGPPWRRFGWPARKVALGAALERARPDILCVQEARAGQVRFIERLLPGHERYGVGRDDGRDGGEHCALFFDRDRFERLGGGTFWLERPIDTPRPGWALAVKRICTWVRLRDRDGGRVLRVYNSHFPLTEPARRRAARIVLNEVAAGDVGDAVVVTGDFNAGPHAVSRRQFGDAGLVDSAVLAGGRPGARTFHLRGMPLLSLDAILVGSGASVERHLVLDGKAGRRYASDHFGLLADLAFE